MTILSTGIKYYMLDLIFDVINYCASNFRCGKRVWSNCNL